MICWKIALCVLVWAAILDGVTTVESKDPVDRGIGETVGKLGSSLMSKYGGKLENLGGNLLSKALPKEGKEILKTVTSVGKSLAPMLSMAGPIGGAINTAIGMFSPEPEPEPDPRIDQLLEDTAEIKNMVQETKESINEVKTQLVDLKEQMQEDIANLGKEMKATMNEMRTEFMSAFGNLTKLVTEQFGELRNELKQQFAELAKQIADGFDKLGRQVKDQFEGQKAYEAFHQFSVTVDAKLEQFARVVKPAMAQSFADKDQNEKLKLRCVTAGYDPLSIISDMYTLALKNCRDAIDLPQACLFKEVMAAAKYKTQTAALLSNWMEAKIFELWTYQMVCAGLIHSEPNSLINDNLIFSKNVDETLKAMTEILPPLMEAYWSGTVVEEFVKKHVPDPRFNETSGNDPFKSCGTALDDQYPLYEHLCIRIHTRGKRVFVTIPKDRSLAISFRHGEESEFLVMRTPAMDESEAAARLQKYTDWLREDVPPEYKEVDKGVHNNNELIGWGVKNATRMGNTTQMNSVKTSLNNTADDRNRVYAHYFSVSGLVSFSEPNENSTCTRARNNQIDECNGRNKPECVKSGCEKCHYHRCATSCKNCCPETYMGTGDRMMKDGVADIPNKIVGCFFVWNYAFYYDTNYVGLGVFVVHGL